MGKRELVLIVAFVLVGAVIYQVTAPPLAPGQEGFSFGRVIQNLRRNVQSRNAQAVVESTRTEPLEPAITELRANLSSAALTVIGEDRPDAAFALAATSNGTDDADAKRLAGLVALKIERTASALVFKLDFPRDGRQSATLVVRVPKRMTVRVEPKAGKLEVESVAALAVKGNRGDTTIRDVPGEVELTQRGGALKLSRAGSLRLTVFNSEAEIADVLGVGSVDATGAKLQLTAIVGPLDVKSRNSDIRLRESPAMKAPLRVDMQAGELDLEGLRSEARVDGRNTEIRVAIEKAAPLTVYNTGEDTFVNLPPGGYTLDAIATDGGLTSDDDTVKVSGDERERRAVGPVRGGGPALTLRATRGAISLRKASQQ
jgi:hypothetical protein